LGKTLIPPYPTWLNKEFEAKLGLRARWEGVNAPVREHPRRPEAYQTLTSPYWQTLFDRWDSGVASYPVEVRHPFFDVRLLTYVLAIPPLPWCLNKELLRCALCGLVPEKVRLRPKTFLWENPVAPHLRREDQGWIDRVDLCPELDQFVERQRIPRLGGEKDADRFELNTRPYCLNNWLNLVARVKKRLGPLMAANRNSPVEKRLMASGYLVK
jgi:asparagine synthase (glutamine-hydrolysing)